MEKDVAESEEAQGAGASFWRWWWNDTNVQTVVFGRIIAADLVAHDSGGNRTTTFASEPVRAGPYDFVAVVEFDKSAAEAMPSVARKDAQDGDSLDIGLLPATIFAILTWFSQELLKGYRRHQLPWALDIDSILRHAAMVVMANAARAIDDRALLRTFDLCLAMNALSALRYERSDCRGEILFAPPAVMTSIRRVDFGEGVPLNAPVWARKMLELTNTKFCLWASSSTVKGLIATAPAGPEENCFRVRFEGQGQWSLSAPEKPLMTVRRGLPSFPSRRVDEVTFRAALARVFKLGAADSDSLWPTVDAVLTDPDGHGALLVICDDAAAEADRLSSQATRILPRVLSIEEARQVIRIDGALLLDTRGMCHAIGVVLDGQASESGSRSRGSRFNSAVRYTLERQKARLALVRSEDGRVDLIPRLRPQVRRTALQAAMARLRGAPPNPERPLINDAELLWKYWDHLNAQPADEGIVRRHLFRVPEDDVTADDQSYDHHPSDVVEDDS